MQTRMPKEVKDILNRTPIILLEKEIGYLKEDLQRADDLIWALKEELWEERMKEFINKNNK